MRVCQSQFGLRADQAAGPEVRAAWSSCGLDTRFRGREAEGGRGTYVKIKCKIKSKIKSKIR